MRYENGVGKWGRVGERDRKREIKMEKQMKRGVGGIVGERVIEKEK